MPVPNTYPKEPGATSCGSTYHSGLYVNGAIAGTDFGAQFKKTIGPVVFADGKADVPMFKSTAQFNNELDGPQGLTAKLAGLKQARSTFYKFFTPEHAASLRWLVLQIEELRRQARDEVAMIQSDPGNAAQHQATAVALISEALPFLRCAEYWTWRIILHAQALAAYKRPVGLQLTSAPVPPPPRAGPREAVLPPPPPPPAPPPRLAWYQTTAGKVAILIGIVTAAAAGGYGISKYAQRA